MNCSKPHKLCWCLLKFQKDLDNPSSSASAQVLSSHNAPNSSVPPPREKPLGTHRNFPEHRVRRTITLTLGGVKIPQENLMLQELPRLVFDPTDSNKHSGSQRSSARNCSRTESLHQFVPSSAPPAQRLTPPHGSAGQNSETRTESNSRGPHEAADFFS